ncbi:peptidylprolyl isomerase [Sediminibacterium sp.]|uniref:peptidylprolyl isomerase n=1 Tax=Sediminibacterium sp. TaxID=1917865 RepID=UPI003F69E44B
MSKRSFIFKQYWINLFLIALWLIACKSPEKKGLPHIIIETGYGEIEIELYTDKAPLTANAFLRYIDSGYYDQSNFYRVLNMYNQPSNAPKAFLIQGGIWKSNNDLAQSLPGIPHESTKQTGILHKEGTISMARNEPGSAGPEFFIMVEDETGFDFGGENMEDGLGFAAFGSVVKGMPIVRKIHNLKEANQYLQPPVYIHTIRRK